MSDLLHIDPPYVRCLHAGVRTELGFAAERLAASLLEPSKATETDEYDRSVALAKAAHQLYTELTEIVADPGASFEVDLDANGLLVLRALECQQIVAVEQEQEAARYGPEPQRSNEEVRALGNLIMQVKRHVRPARDDKTEPFVEPPVTEGRTHSGRRGDASVGSPITTLRGKRA